MLSVWSSLKGFSFGNELNDRIWYYKLENYVVKVDNATD